jgi:hypothetical protein
MSETNGDIAAAAVMLAMLEKKVRVSEDRGITETE